MLRGKRWRQGGTSVAHRERVRKSRHHLNEMFHGFRSFVSGDRSHLREGFSALQGSLNTNPFWAGVQQTAGLWRVLSAICRPTWVLGPHSLAEIRPSPLNTNLVGTYLPTTYMNRLQSASNKSMATSLTINN